MLNYAGSRRESSIHRVVGAVQEHLVFHRVCRYLECWTVQLEKHNLFSKDLLRIYYNQVFVKPPAPKYLRMLKITVLLSALVSLFIP